MEVGQGPNWGCSAKGKKYIIDIPVVVWEIKREGLQTDGELRLIHCA
jgi:hypothetical protein